MIPNNNSHLRKQISFIHIRLSILLGQFGILGTGLAYLESMHKGPKPSPNENRGSNGQKSSMIVTNNTAFTTERQFESSGGSGGARGEEEDFVHGSSCSSVLSSSKRKMN